MKCGGEMTNKYNIGQTLYHPRFTEQGCLWRIAEVVVERIELVVKKIGLNMKMQHIEYAVREDVYPLEECVPEEDLFTTLDDAEKYAYYQGMAQIENIKHALKEIEKRFPELKEKKDE